MIKLDKPDYVQEEIFNDCIENMQEGTRLTHLLASKQTIIDESNNFNTLAESGKLSSIKTHTCLAGGATKDDMVWVYTNKFVGDGGRNYYDKIKLISKNGICPLCGHRTVSTLDHYLAKTKYPTFAITPFNLVPSCFDCNNSKKTKDIFSREEETIHPYYDDFEDEVWLKAEVIEQFPIGFMFSVDKPIIWSDEKYKRAKCHLDTFKLNQLYSIHAAEEFISYKNMMKKLYKRGGESLVREDLNDRIESKQEFRFNTWQAAMYKALYDSKWLFCTYIPKEII